jgi:hypothetical protein
VGRQGASHGSKWNAGDGWKGQSIVMKVRDAVQCVCVPETEVGGRVGDGAEDVLDGVNDLMNHHLTEIVMLALPTPAPAPTTMRLVFAHECMIVFLLLIVAVMACRGHRGGVDRDWDGGFGEAGVEDDGFDEEHPGDGDQGQEDQRGLHARLPHVQPAGTRQASQQREQGMTRRRGVILEKQSDTEQGCTRRECKARGEWVWAYDCIMLMGAEDTESKSQTRDGK